MTIKPYKTSGWNIMNKKDLIDEMSKDTKMSKADCERALDSLLKNVYKGAKKENVQLVGFGTFKTVNLKARTGVNPQTGAKIKIPAKKAFKFSASKNPKF